MRASKRRGFDREPMDLMLESPSKYLKKEATDSGWSSEGSLPTFTSPISTSSMPEEEVESNSTGPHWEREEDNNEWETGSLILSPYLQRSKRTRTPPPPKFIWPTSTSATSDDTEISELWWENEDESENSSHCSTPYLERSLRPISPESPEWSPLSMHNVPVTSTPLYSKPSLESTDNYLSISSPMYDPDDEL